jgi:hypothetical protein
MCSPLCQNCVKTLSVLAVGVSSRAKADAPSCCKQKKMEGSDRGFGVVSRACKAGALPAEPHAPCNYLILIVSLIEFRGIDYLLCWQVLTQIDRPTHDVQPSPCDVLTMTS